MMRQRVQMLISIILISAALIACGSSETDSTTGSVESANNNDSGSEEQLVLKLAHILPETHALHRGTVKFAETLNELSEGQIEVEIYSNGVMGYERDIVEAMQIGSLDFVTVTSAITGTFNDDYNVFSLPFLFDNYEHMFRVIDHPSVAEVLHPKLIEAGIRPLPYWVTGARSYYGPTEVKSIEDLQGLQVRSMEDSTIVRTWEMLGASPTVLPFGEVYNGLQTGLIDGAEGTISSFISSNFYESAPNVSMIEYIFGVQNFNIAEQTWQKLNDEQRQWVEEAARIAADYQREDTMKEEKGLVERLEELDVNVSFPDIEPFREAIAPIYEDYREEVDPEVYELVELAEELRN